MVAGQATALQRSDVPQEQTWNKESVFATRSDWDTACDTLSAKIASIGSFKGRLGEGPATLADYLDAEDDLNALMGKVFTYSAMSASVDGSNEDATAMQGRAMSLMGRAAAATAFKNPEMIAIGQATLDRWMAEEPRLAYVRHYVDNLFRAQEHVRSAEVEEVLGMLRDPFGGARATFTKLTDTEIKFAPAVDSQGNTHVLNQSNYYVRRRDTDRAIRRSAYENYTDGYLAFQNTLAANLSTAIKQDVFRARVRGFDTALEAALFANNIPVTVLDNLLDTFQRNLPTWHKYWNVRRRVLGYDELHPYDIWAPLTEKSPVVSYDMAVDWITEGMKPLGEDYVSVMRRGCLEDRWVDYPPNEGKRQGAFSDGTHATMPFIMMSYTDDMGSMSTLAHELGHSMHSHHSRTHQPITYSGYSMFVAEVASNFNQALTRAYLREVFADDTTFQIALIEEAMGNFHRYFFIMPTLARFERELHTRVEQGRGVTASELNTLMVDLFAEGYGDELTFDRDREGITWATFPHMYMNFYVYQYATGISAAHALADRVLTGEADAAQRYVEFLSAGSSMYAIDALKHAGVDMTQPDAVETTFAVLADYVDRLEQLTGV